MALAEIGQPKNWTEAFDVARRLLLEEKLTAVALVSEQEYTTGRYVATHLEEFAAAMGCVDAVLGNLEHMAPMLYKGAVQFRLMHGAVRYGHPMLTGEGWMLVIVYNNGDEQ